jgi:hypothetical protein
MRGRQHEGFRRDRIKPTRKRHTKPNQKKRRERNDVTSRGILRGERGRRKRKIETRTWVTS